MRDSKSRRHIAVEAARLMYERVESEYFTAKRKAAARLGVNFKHQPQHLPSNREIRDELQVFARIHEGERRLEGLAEMRSAALRMMRLLAPFEPRLIGSVCTGHVRAGSDIDLHVFALNVSGITDILEADGYRCHVEYKRVIKHGEARMFTHVHLHGQFPFELTVYAPELVGYRFKSSITGKAIERASIHELEALIAREHPGIDVGAADDTPTVDRLLIWSLLLTPLENVKQRADYHPEGDALYHSLQAFEIARREFPYDQELITAALLHDVGKAIDPRDHVAAGLEALEGTLTPRERFLIAHHMDAQAERDGTLGTKRSARLRENEWHEDLMCLRDIDDGARRRGVDVCTIEEALSFLREMDRDDVE